MKKIVVAGAALNQLPLDWEGNRKRIVTAIEKARDLGANVLCLPELCLSGYGCEDAFLFPSTIHMAYQSLKLLVPYSQGMIVVVGLPVIFEGRLYDAAAVLVDGQLAGVVCKQNPLCDGLRQEYPRFQPWPSGKQAEIDLANTTVPIGDLVFDCGGIRLAVKIGADVHTDQLTASGNSRACNLVLNPVAEPFGMGAFASRKDHLAKLSARWGIPQVSTNLLGNEAGRIIYDGSVIFAEGGEIVALGPRLTFRPLEVTACVIGVEEADPSGLKAISATDFPDLPGVQVHRVGFSWPEQTSRPLASPRELPAWEQSAHVIEEEVTRALALALYDYMRKARARGFLVSLSGGADSSSVACLVTFAIRWAYRDLGRDEFLAALDYFPELAEANHPAEIVQRLLRCVYQPSRNSSQASFRSAQAVANALGVPLGVISIDPFVDRYVQAAEGVLGRALTWQKDDIALQNIQSRVRGPMAWLLANAEGKILVATGNRSEAIVGYATMDGDTCGGISPIGGLSKPFLRKWLQWVEKVGPSDFGPIPALAEVNRLAPSAELRPLQEGQTDESDLMPYEVLEAIDEGIFRDRLPWKELWGRLQERFPGYPREQLAEWIGRFLTLCSQNQWKRDRMAPAFFVGDPQGATWTTRRLPLLSAGFTQELAELNPHP
jgi:NAD+ synthase (glutamine-hydrolysing)